MQLIANCYRRNPTAAYRNDSVSRNKKRRLMKKFPDIEYPLWCAGSKARKMSDKSTQFNQEIQN